MLLPDGQVKEGLFDCNVFKGAALEVDEMTREGP
jgi:hypothetical protein